MRSVTSALVVKKYFILTILFLAIFLTGCATQSQNEQIVQDENKNTNEIAIPEETTDQIIEEEQEENMESSGSIVVSSVKDGDTLVSPALIEGEANVESGMVIVELRNTDHEAVSSSVEAAVRDGKYKISEFWFQFKNTKDGFVAVYDRDNMENIVEIPVKFQTIE